MEKIAIDPANKVSAYQLTARVGRSRSYMSFLGEYERSVNIILQHLIDTKSNLDLVANPLLYLMRHSLELGYKQNIPYFHKYSELAFDPKDLKSHNLSKLHMAFGKQVEAVIEKFNIEEETKNAFRDYYNSTGKLIENLGSEEASSFRYAINVRGAKIFAWNDEINAASLKQPYDKAITMLIHSCDLVAQYTDYQDFIEAHPDFKDGIGKVFMVFKNWELEFIMDKLNSQYEAIGDLRWKDSVSGNEMIVFKTDETCYWLPIK